MLPVQTLNFQSRCNQPPPVEHEVPLVVQVAFVAVAVGVLEFGEIGFAAALALVAEEIAPALIAADIAAPNAFEAAVGIVAGLALAAEEIAAALTAVDSAALAASEAAVGIVAALA